MIAGFWAWATQLAYLRGAIDAVHRRAMIIWLILLALWGMVSTTLSIRGVYRSDAFLALLPGLWFALMPVVLSLALLAAWPAFRRALVAVTVTTSPRAFMFLHGVRIAAIGSVYKAHEGLLPPSFAYPIGIADMLFGVLSVLLAINYRRIEPNRSAILVWNGLGMVI